MNITNFVKMCNYCQKRIAELPATLGGLLEGKIEICQHCQAKVDVAVSRFLKYKFGSDSIRKVYKVGDRLFLK